MKNIDCYTKHKNAYFEQYGGKALDNSNNNDNNFDEIVNFLKKSKKADIVNKFYGMINNATYCPVVLGQGFAGKAYLPEIDKYYPYKIGKKIIELPIVVKVENVANDRHVKYFGLDILDNTLYINGYGGLTTEAIILMFVRQLRNKTVHLPLLLAYSTCSNDKTIDRMYTLRYGLDKPVDINLDGKVFNEHELWHKRENPIDNVFRSTLATLHDLLAYMHYSEKNGIVTLPNNVKCKTEELYDYLCISFFATHRLLTNNNIYPSDNHPGNMFIHWLSDTSYHNDRNIKNVKQIIYDVKGKKYKIETFGFVLIFGDTGTYNIDIQKNVVLIGQSPDIKNVYAKHRMVMNETHANVDFIYYSYNMLTPTQLQKTIAFKIMSMKPYCDFPLEYHHLLGTDVSFLKNKKTTVELLELFYEKYGIKTKGNKNDYDKGDSILLKVN